MSVHTRDELFGEDYKPRVLGDFLKGSGFEGVPNRFKGKSPEELRPKLKEYNKWRHHHEFDELKSGSNLYSTYADRIDGMLEMIDWGFKKLGIDEKFLSSTSCLDLAASEGFMSRSLLERGALSVDCFELNKDQIERMFLVAQISGYADKLKSFRIDLDTVDWSTGIKKYGMVFCLGIIYHLENPLLFCRNLYQISDKYCVVESDTPGSTSSYNFRGNGCIYFNQDQLTIEPGNIRALFEMRPSRYGLVQMLLFAGFKEVLVVPDDVSEKSKYFQRGEKSVMIAVK